MRGDETPAEATANLTRLIARRAGMGRGDLVCDVGCGYGGPARSFASACGARVVAVTLSRRQVEHARRRTAPEQPVSYLLGDWLANPLTDGSFSAVVAIESASHMPDKREFLRQARRVLTPGGRLVVAAWLSADNPSAWARRWLLEPICDEGRLPGLASESEYRGWMEPEGLRVVAFDDLSDRVRRTWSVCVRRVVGRLVRDPEARRYVLDARNSERVFALGVARIWAAYSTGALRYGVFTAEA